MKISCIVLTKNEELLLPICLKSVSWCDEIIIIDDFSIDNTISIAKKYAVKIFSRKLNSDFSAQRNFGLKKAKGEWVLFLDADEYVPKSLASKIRKILNDTKFDGFLLRRTDIFLGKKLIGGESGNSYLLRLAKKGAGQWRRAVHEKWDVPGKLGMFGEPIYHNSHPNVSQFVDQINYFSQLHFKESSFEGKKSNILKIIIYPIFKFFINFLVKYAFRDGTHGFVSAMFMSFHSFLSWSELWITRKSKN